MIEEVFGQLKDIGLVRSGNDFSRSWLGMEESYFRCIRAKGTEPSVKVLARCAQRLKVHGDTFSKSRFTDIRDSGKQLQVLADRCVQHIFDVSV